MPKLFFLTICSLLFLSTPFFSSLRAEEEIETVTMTVDFTQPTGMIKPLNGTNLGPRLITSKFNNAQQLFDDAGFSLVRLHDAPWDNPAMRLVDVPMIFGNLHADPSDPDNYFFEATDDYLKSILKSGRSKILYRLGTSIEHSAPNTYFTKEPDHAQFAEICAGIIRHYNEGWADGFRWNIEYWEIWNEPDCGPCMWDSEDFAVYCRFYVDVAKRLKAEFPNIKIGGPALTCPDLEKIADLADLCKAEGAPLDFVSWHNYFDDPRTIFPAAERMREMLDEHGFPEAELHLNEWHYMPGDWSTVAGVPEKRETRIQMNSADDGMNGIDSAAAAAWLLIRWQDAPLDMACYYCTALVGGDDWGMIDQYGYPRKTYYLYKEFAELLDKTGTRAACGEVGDSFAILAGTGPDGDKSIMISSFKQSVKNLHISMAGTPESGEVTVISLDPGPNAEPMEKKIRYENRILDLGPIEESGIRFIRWKR